MEPVIDVQPTTYPVSVSAMRSQSRIVDDFEDAYLEAYSIPAACDIVSNYLGRTLSETTYSLYFRCFPRSRRDSYGNVIGHDCIELPMPPYMELVKFRYLKNGEWVDLAEGVDYKVDEFSASIPRLIPAPGASWTQYAVDDTPGAVHVQWKAGYDDPSMIPKAILHGIMLVAAALYENRESTQSAPLIDLKGLIGVPQMLQPYVVVTK